MVLLIKSGVSSLISVVLNYTVCQNQKGITYTRRINLKLHKKQGGIKIKNTLFVCETILTVQKGHHETITQILKITSNAFLIIYMNWGWNSYIIFLFSPSQFSVLYRKIGQNTANTIKIWFEFLCTWLQQTANGTQRFQPIITLWSTLSLRHKISTRGKIHWAKKTPIEKFPVHNVDLSRI